MGRRALGRSSALPSTHRATTLLLTAVSVACFAANSLLCRQALATGSIDPATFTAIRVTSGALALALLVRARGGGRSGSRSGWLAAAALFLYAAPFSIAYVRIGAAVGALVLFAAVQVTMFGWSIVKGERLGARVWLGLALALAGLAILTLPGASAPSPIGVAAMGIAGVAWGAYTLLGRSAKADPTAMTAAAFVRATPLALALLVGQALQARAHASVRGALLAVASGVIASAAGYAVWYRTVPRLAASTAAVVQLLVPVVAAVGAAALLGERPSPRLVGAGAVIVAGVVLATVRRRR